MFAMDWTTCKNDWVSVSGELNHFIDLAGRSVLLVILEARPKEMA